MSPEHSKDSSLFWLRVYIRPHLLGRTMFDGHFLLVDLVLDEEILHPNLLGSLRAARPPVSLEQDSTHVVLIEQGWIVLSGKLRVTYWLLTEQERRKWS